MWWMMKTPVQSQLTRILWVPSTGIIAMSDGNGENIVTLNAANVSATSEFFVAAYYNGNIYAFQPVADALRQYVIDPDAESGETAVYTSIEDADSFITYISIAPSKNAVLYRSVTNTTLLEAYNYATEATVNVSANMRTRQMCYDAGTETYFANSEEPDTWVKFQLDEGVQVINFEELEITDANPIHCAIHGSKLYLKQAGDDIYSYDFDGNGEALVSADIGVYEFGTSQQANKIVVNEEVDFESLYEIRVYNSTFDEYSLVASSDGRLTMSVVNYVE